MNFIILKNVKKQIQAITKIKISRIFAKLLNLLIIH